MRSLISNLYKGQLPSTLLYYHCHLWNLARCRLLACLWVHWKQTLPTPLLCCICISVFPISLGSKWFRIFETAKTKGDKVNEWHYWGQPSTHISVFSLTLLWNATKIIAKPDNRNLLTEEKGITELLSVKLLTSGIKRTMLPWLCKRLAGLSQIISYEIICRLGNRRDWLQEVWKPSMDYINKVQAVP